MGAVGGVEFVYVDEVGALVSLGGAEPGWLGLGVDDAVEVGRCDGSVLPLETLKPALGGLRGLVLGAGERPVGTSPGTRAG